MIDISTKKETKGQDENKHIVKEANSKSEAIRVHFSSCREASLWCVGSENHNDPIIFFTNTHSRKLRIVQTQRVL